MTLMTDSEIRALCHRFFDALETKDHATVAALYRDDLAFWFNVTDKTSTKAENLAALEAGAAIHKSRSYNERIVNTFRGGFVMQYTVTIEQHDGRKLALFPCVVAHCRDGQITRMDEYIDSGKFTRAPRPQPAAGA
jgi:ketosteroid isomerase-like protein